MKKTIFPILVVAFIITGYFILSKYRINIEPVGNYQMGYTLYQIGAYQEEDIANKKADDYYGVVIYDDNIYHVYSALISNITIKNIYQEYLQKNNVEYYPLNINLNNQLQKKVKLYEQVLITQEVNNVFQRLMQELLLKYKESIM